jgi:hypothetical protein
MKIAIITPSRGRPKELFRFYESIKNTMSGQNRVYFLFGIDEDDPAKEDYYNILRSMLFLASPNLKVLMTEEKRRPIGKIWNELSRMKSWQDGPDLFIMGNDDLVYQTKNWDLIIEEKVLSAEHPFFCYWFEDEINGATHCAFPILTKYWISAVGYFAPECFNFFFHDTWVFDIAKKAGLTRFVPEVVAKHMHFTATGEKMDSTYKHWRDNDTNNADTLIFKNTEKSRQATAEMLKERIVMFQNSNKTPNAENNSSVPKN